ncbi:MAG: anti-sigma factor domain-containing protein [Bacillota bacterium]|nr:anti-sigma factor domain-containing protein [Bacillota bacterium]
MDNFGYVYKIYGNKAVILTSSKGFIKIKKSTELKLGYKVYFEEKDIIKPNKRIYYFTSVAATFFIVFMSIRFLMGIGSVYGYVDVDINPSIDFAVNKEYVVVKAAPLNSDAQKILKSYNFKGKHLDDAITVLLTKSEEYGYIKTSDNNVIVSMSLDRNSKKNDSSADENKLKVFVNDIKALNKGNITKQVLLVNYDERIEAKKYNLSMGKYFMYLKAKEKNSNITIDEVKRLNNTQLLEAAGVILDSSYIKNNKQADSSNIQNKEEPTPSISNQISEPENNSKTTPTVTKAPTIIPTPIVIPSVSITPTAIPTVPVTPASVVQYDFENDNVSNYTISTVENSKVANSRATLKITSNRKYSGTYSMEENIIFDGDIIFNVNNIKPGITAGKTITFYVFIPGINIKQMSPFIEDSDGNYYYNWVECSKLDLSKWNGYTLTVPSNVKTPIKALGLKAQTDGVYSAHIYIDDISWPVN